MQEIIKIETLGNDIKAVSGRVLYEKLGIESRYNDWINKYIKKYDLMENEDYQTLTQKKVTAQGNQSTFNEHIIRLDHAKKICMVTNNEVGNKIRDYFLECEKQLAKPKTTLELLELAVYELKQKDLLIEEKDIKINTLIHNKKTYTSSELATELGFKSAIALNKKLCNEKIIRKVNGSFIGYSYYNELGYFDLKQTELPSGKIVYNLRFTGKGRNFLIELLGKEKNK
jgi:anti-repressor protein